MDYKDTFSEEQIKIARLAKALGHPVRIYIVEFLSKKACCYSGDLSEILPIAKSTLSQHLKELKDAGLIKGQLETPKIRYCLDEKTWKLVKKLFKNLLQIN